MSWYISNNNYDNTSMYSLTKVQVQIPKMKIGDTIYLALSSENNDECNLIENPNGKYVLNGKRYHTETTHYGVVIEKQIQGMVKKYKNSSDYYDIYIWDEDDEEMVKIDTDDIFLTKEDAEIAIDNFFDVRKYDKSIEEVLG